MPTGVLHLKEVDTDQITLDGTLSVSGASALEGATVAHSTLSVGGAATLADANAANVNVSGTLSVAGQTTMGGDIIPDTNDAYDIGSPEFKIRDLYVSNNSIWVGDDMKISNEGGKLKFRKRKTNVVPQAILDAGANAGHANEQATADAALAHAGVGDLGSMKLQHWFKFMRTLNSAAKLADIFRNNNDDYEESSASDAWKEIENTNKIYTNSLVGVGTSDPDDTLHVKGSFKVESETGFQLIRSTVGADDPQLIIDTKQFGVDETIEDLTGQGLSKFTKLYRVYGTNSEGYGRDWYWGLANDDYTNISLAVGGESGGNDPDLAFTFTTASELYCNKVFAALGGNADSATLAAEATKLATPRKINGVDFDGTQDITIDTGSDGVDGITSLNGNIGIGKSSPTAQLHISSGNSGDCVLKIEADEDDNDETDNPRIEFITDGGFNTALVGAGQMPFETTNDNALVLAAHQMKFYTGTQNFNDSTNMTEKMRIRPNGNVGLGTSSPRQNLHVHESGSGQVVIAVTNDTTGGEANDGIHFGIDGSEQGFVWHKQNTALLFATNNTERMRLTNDGKLGINTSNPDERLHVTGNIHLVGDMRMSWNNDRYMMMDYDTSYRQGFHFDAANRTARFFSTGANSDGGAISFQTRDWTSPNQDDYGVSRMYIASDGLVGVGTTSPKAPLHVKSASTNVLKLQCTVNGGVGIAFSDIAGANPNQNGYLTYYHQDVMSYNTGNMFKFSTDQGSETFAVGGTLMIGVDGKDAGVTGDHMKQLFFNSTFGGRAAGSLDYGWWVGTQNQRLISSDNDLYFTVMRAGSPSQVAYIQDDTAFAKMNRNLGSNFTGQHRTFVKGVPASKIEIKEGLIVCADQNDFIKMSGGVVRGNEAITVSESLPVVSLSSKAKDKKCFGVIAMAEDPDTRTETYGVFTSIIKKEEGDTRVYVNSVGEGGIWVINSNGILESGDYITTSDVPGYGMKQDDDLLHNYTVAKILMDCDFNPQIQKKQEIWRELTTVDYWIRYGKYKITLGEYEELPVDEREIKDGEYFRITQEEVLKEDPYNEVFVHEKRDEWKNVLDVNGELQWKTLEEEERAYNIRYLDAKGKITTKENAVHVAAFVGCTYHCG